MKYIPIDKIHIKEVIETLKDFGYTLASVNQSPFEPEQIIADFNIGVLPKNALVLLYIINEKMLQDKRVKELLLGYVV